MVTAERELQMRQMKEHIANIEKHLQKIQQNPDESERAKELSVRLEGLKADYEALKEMDQNEWRSAYQSAYDDTLLTQSLVMTGAVTTLS